MTMSPEIAAQGLVSSLVIALWLLFWFGPWRWIAEDWARESMFAARESLFDMAASGRISFDDPNYQAVRAAINSQIRFAHACSVTRMWFHLRAKGDAADRHVADDVRSSAAAISDPVVRQAAEDALEKVGNAGILLVFWKSPFLCLVIGLIAVRISVVRNVRDEPIMDRLLKGLRPYADLIQSEAALS